MKEINFGVLGAGTVGSGVIKILNEKKADFESKFNTKINVKEVVVKNLDKKRPEYFDDLKISNNPENIVNNPDIDVVIELIGGEYPAKDLILKSINNGKHIITANKEVIAKHGQEIFSLAKEKNVFIFIEGAVAGGIPIIQTMNRDLISNKINSLIGIINGTTNYILTEMTQKKRDFSEVLKEAQDLGFAEADPTSDIEAFDSAYKLLILSSLFINKNLKFDSIYREGISNVSVKDIEYANKLGYTIKLLAISKENDNGKYEARVHPTMISENHPLASVSGAFNAIWINGDSLGEFMLYGQGAGQLPTASAVTADVLNLIKEINQNKKPFHIENNQAYEVVPMEDIISKYYIRVLTKDKPGVIGLIGKILGESGVSVNSLWQANANNNQAEIVIITHPVKELKINESLDKLKKEIEINEIKSLIRVEDI